MAHSFTTKNFLLPEVCSVCRKLLWGLVRQGQECGNCGMVVHERCAKQAVSCSKTLVAKSSTVPVASQSEKPQPEKKEPAQKEASPAPSQTNQSAPVAPTEDKKDSPDIQKENLDEEGIIWNDAWQVLDIDDESENNSDDQLDQLLQTLRKKSKPQPDPSIPASYSGPRIPTKGIDNDFCIELTKWLEQRNPLPLSIATQIISQATEIMAKEHNFSKAHIPMDGRLILVGDTHGQIDDVATIFRLNGYPSLENRFLFNGDFVDRGPDAVEIVLTLYAWKIANPVQMLLNRGNHEDPKLNEKYGFAGEVTRKYHYGLFELITKSFTMLPLGHIIEDRFLVVHGGLPEQDDETLESLQKMDRKMERIPKHSPLEGILWSDPASDEETTGKQKSSRGAGVKWGPQATESFLKKNKLEKIIRSHQKMDQGFFEHHSSQVVTLFSASYYCGTNFNQGGYAICFWEKEKPEILFKSYFAKKTSAITFDPMEMQRQTSQKIKDKIFQYKAELLYTYTLMDPDKNGEISIRDWGNGLTSVLKLHLPWDKLQPYFAKTNSKTGQINYKNFLDRFKLKSEE